MRLILEGTACCSLVSANLMGKALLSCWYNVLELLVWEHLRPLDFVSEG